MNKHQEVLNLVYERIHIDDIIRNADEAGKIIKPGVDSYRKSQQDNSNGELVTSIDSRVLTNIEQIANSSNSTLKETFVRMNFKPNNLNQLFDYLKTQPEEVQTKVYNNLLKIANDKPEAIKLLNHFYNTKLDNGDVIRDTVINDAPSIGTPTGGNAQINSEEVVTKINSSLGAGLKERFDEVMASGQGNIIIGFVIAVLVMGPIIYFLFFKNGNNKVKQRYGISLVDLDSLFNMYYDVWQSDKIKTEIYHNNYNEYKKSMFDQYIDFHYIIKYLSSSFKTILLADIKNGTIRKEFMEPKNHNKTLQFRFNEIDEVMHLIIASSVKLNQSEFNKLMRL